MKLNRFQTLVVLATIFAPAAIALAATPVAVEKSIARGKEWLYAQQQNGNWELVRGAEPVGDAESMRDPKAGNFTGRSALAVLALLYSGEHSSDPRLKSAIDFILKSPTSGTYALGLRCQLWLALPESPAIQQAMRHDAQILLTSAKTSGTARGMYDYAPGPSKTYSHSRSQYAILGLWAAAQMGAEIPDAYWQNAESAWRRNQDKSGGWSYQNPSDTPFPPTPGMTTVGVASMVIIQEQLRGDAANCKATPGNPSIDRGIAWLAKNMNLYATGSTYSRYFPYATLYAYERVGAAAGLRYFGDIDWYEKGADFALHQQNANGGWTWAASDYTDAVVNTSFALLFLSKGRAPIVMSKLQYAGAAGKEGSWNQRGRDAANVVRWIGHTLERELAFQVVDLKVSLDDMLESPLLYIAGSDAVNFTPDEEAKIKAYIEGGGIVLANANCAGTAFTGSIKKLAKDLFPDAEFGEIPQDNVIYTGSYPRAGWKSKPSVLSITNGARQLMVLIPQADPAKAWQLKDVKSRKEMFELPADLLLYAVDRQDLRYRGDSYYVHDDPATKASKTIAVARLKYSGFSDPEPGGWRRLNSIMKKRQSIALDITSAELGKNQIGTAKIAHLTGTYEYKFTDAQCEELKQFIAGGGTLVIDAAGGSSRFAVSVEDALARMYPKEKLTTLPPDHPLFTAGGGAADEISYRTFAARNGVGKTTAPRLHGVNVDGRLAVIYSREDLSVGLVGQAVDGIIGYSPDTATNLMTRILNYASGSSGSPPKKK
ncbi:DUF4159 domain-containing protein [soil metagenome]